MGLSAGRGALGRPWKRVALGEMWRREAVEATSKRVEASKRLEKVRNGGARGRGKLIYGALELVKTDTTR